jgi:hypothetical protein
LLSNTLYMMRVVSPPATPGHPTGEPLQPSQRTRWLEAAWLSLETITLLAMVVIVVTRIWQDHVWAGWALVGIAVLVWAPEFRLRRARRWWFVYVAGTFIYTLLRSYADSDGMPIQTMYTIDFDHFLFFGHDPVVWLQDHLFSPAHVTPLDFLAVQVHWSFFVVPHAVAIAIFVWKRRLFPRYVALVVGTLYVGLVLFFLVPTTPPWLAARAGELPGVFRIMDFVGNKANGSAYTAVYSSIGEPNSVAAMPSIHMAITFALYLWARDHQPRLAPYFLVYSIVMGAALIYLAEHYLLDLLIGMLCAIACHLVTRRIVPIATAPTTTPTAAQA